MKKILILIVAFACSSVLIAQDYASVCRTLNHPPLLKLIAFGNSLNANLRIIKDHKYLIERTNMDCNLEISFGSKSHLIILDTANNFTSQNELNAANSIEIYNDSLGRIQRTVDHGTFVEEYIYNDASKLIEIKSYYDNSDGSKLLLNLGSKQTGWTGKYDDQGRLIEETTYEPGKPDWRTVYTWQGNKIVSSESFNPWNKDGKYIKEIYSYENELLSIIEGFNVKNKKKYTLEYQWIEKGQPSNKR